MGHRDLTTGDRTVTTLCRMCEQGCGMDVTLGPEGPIRVRGDKGHPYSRGWLCIKGMSALDFFSSPRRLTTPLIRGEDGLHRQASWEEALSVTARELHRIRETYGPQSLAIYHGEGVGHQEIKSYMKRFANVYGTPNFMGVGSLCNAARTMADTLTLGQVTRPDIPNTRFLMVWGGNPLVSNEPTTPLEMHRLARRNAALAVVDPRQTPTAGLADYHLAVRPGKDGVLAANLLHVILRQGLWDRPFTNNWISGFSGLEGAADDRFSPEAGERETGVPADLVRRVAVAYASIKPACLLIGNGLEHHGRGIDTMRLLAVLKALTGNLDVPGGDLFSSGPRLWDITAPLPPSPIPPLGSEAFPLFCRLRQEAHALAVPDAILEGRPYPIRAMIIAGGNPSLEWPNSRRVRAALEKLEFRLVIDVVDSPDTRTAQVILPACTFLERDEHRVPLYHNQQIVLLRKKVLEPVYGLPDQTIWIRLAQAMGYGEHFPWAGPRDGLDHILGGLGINYRDMAKHEGRFEYEARRYRKYETGGFRTPSGKVEVEPERLRQFGYDPSPLPQVGSRESAWETDYPLLLSTGANLLPYLHWQYRDLPRLRRLAPEPRVEIHPDTARRYGLADRDLAEVETPKGRIRLKTWLTPGIQPDTIHIPQGWEEANANELTGAETPDPISGFPNLKSNHCRIRKVSVPRE
jgi:formate dehydrogenase (coenzyme F420) alpha subunit